jgi:superfamily I DNA/RNA helicase
VSWLLERTELTAEQLRAVELPPTEHRLILGGPGSGKTQVLLHRAAFLRDRERVPADRYHIFVFTNTLKNYIRSALDLLDVPPSCVTTLDSWCREYHRHNIGPEPRIEASNSRFNSKTQPDFAAIRHAVAQRVSRSRRPPALYDYVLVDEGQDLDEEVFGLLCAVSKHVTVCMDRKQQIYERGSDERAILRQLGLRKRNLALLDTLRCSPYVTAVAAALVDDPEEGREFQRQVKVAQTERETPVVYFAHDFEAERRKLLDIIQVRQRRGDRIAILLPQKRQVMGFAKGLVEDGLAVEAQDEIDFASDAPKVLTYHSAKGLTFDTVLMPRLVSSSFKNLRVTQVQRLLFVGVSRAVTWVYFSTDENQRFAPLDKVTALAAGGQVTLQGARRQRDLIGDQISAAPTAPGDTPRAVPRVEPEEDDTLDFPF